MMAITSSDNICAVCADKSPGFHFGVITCRACAAFFRRSLHSKKLWTCKKGNDKCSVVSISGFFNCKKCRLRKCLEVGMAAEQKPLANREIVENRYHLAKNDIPTTVGSFQGYPDFIIFRSRPQLFAEQPKSVIDVKFLMQKAIFILEQGAESPLHSRTSLEKLAVGLGRVQYRYQMKDIRLMKTFGKEDTLAQWEFEFLKLVSWLTYFDKFLQLPQCLQISMIKSVWNGWNRLLFLQEVVKKCKEHFGEMETIRMTNGTLVYDWSHVEFDMSWCSRYPMEQIRCFLDIPSQFKIDELVRMMIELNPTDVEMSYMLCQLSFHYIGKRHNREVLEMVEEFQEGLANDLHQYYVEELKKPNYAGRLSSMMKINNGVQNKMRKNASKIEMAVLFDIVNCECTHPDMFVDIC